MGLLGQISLCQELYQLDNVTEDFFETAEEN